MPSHKPQFDFVELPILHHASEGSLYGLWMIEELAEHGYSLNASQLRFHCLQRRGYLSRTDKGRQREVAQVLSHHTSRVRLSQRAEATTHGADQRGSDGD